MRQRNRNTYKSTYQVSQYGRPVTQRLTPLAYICMGIAGFFVLFGAAVFIGRWLDRRPSDLAANSGMTARGTPGSGTAAVVVETVGQAPAYGATATPVINRPRNTSTPRPPTRTPEPTVERPTVAADQVAALPTANAIEWTNQMTQTETGEWMAPLSQKERTEKDVRAYFDALLAHKSPQDAYRDLVENRDRFFARYFEGEALRTIKSALSQDKLNVLKSGDVDVRVVRYTKDGSMATVSIAKRGWIIDAYDRATLADPVEQSLRDEDVMWLVRYSASEGRWKIMNTTSLPTGGRVFSDEGRRSFEKFVAEVTKNQQANATPTPTP
jgi:hypothetical protein